MADRIVMLLDRLAIQDLAVKYGMAVDRRDWELYREVFTKNAVIDYSAAGGFSADLETTVEWLPQSLGRYLGLQHNMTSHTAEIEGDDARACTYFVAVHSYLDDSGVEVLLTMGGHYRDHVVRTQDGWRIAHRACMGGWIDGPFKNPPSWYGTNNDDRRPSLSMTHTAYDEPRSDLIRATGHDPRPDRTGSRRREEHR
jgi:hypothetical protein